MKTTIARAAEILGQEAVKTLARVYGRTEDQVILAVIAGHPKVTADLQILIKNGYEAVKDLVEL